MNVDVIYLEIRDVFHLAFTPNVVIGSSIKIIEFQLEKIVDGQVAAETGTGRTSVVTHLASLLRKPLMWQVRPI